MKDGLVFLGAGLLSSSISSLIERFVPAGTAADFVCGFLTGLSAVFFGAAVYMLIRNRRPQG